MVFAIPQLSPISLCWLHCTYSKLCLCRQSLAKEMFVQGTLDTHKWFVWLYQNIDNHQNKSNASSKIEIAIFHRPLSLTHVHLLKGRTIRLQGGEQEVWVRTSFFFLQPGKESFFYFQYLMGQVFFFLALNGASFFFFLIKFVFNTHSKWNLDKQNITCIYIKYVVVLCILWTVCLVFKQVLLPI